MGTKPEVKQGFGSLISKTRDEIEKAGRQDLIEPMMTELLGADSWYEATQILAKNLNAIGYQS